MFGKNPDDMRMEQTPERVLAICRMAARGRLSQAELFSALNLGFNTEKEKDAIRKCFNVAANELHMVRLANNMVEIEVPESAVETPAAFRRYVASRVFKSSDTTFMMFSKWVIGKNESLFEYGKWENMAVQCKTELPELTSLNENGVLGWRFWAAFLGLGYLSGTMLIPNMKTRIQDVLATDFGNRFKYGEAVRATDFCEWLRGQLPECEIGIKLPLALSAGLRTLADLGLIKLESWRDANRISLYPVDGEPLNDFSHITVYDEVQK